MPFQLYIRSLLAIFILPVLAVSAQDSSVQTYVDPNGAVAFDYPAGWTLDQADTDMIVLSSTEAAIAIFLPDAVENADLTDVTDRELVATEVGTALANDDGGELSTLRIGRKSAARYDFVNNQGSPALVVVFPFADSDRLMVFSAFAKKGDTSAVEDIVVEIASSVEIPEIETTSLQDYDQDWRTAVAELEQNGLIGSGGSLIFQENRAFFSGRGNWYTPLATYAPRADIVMAGQLTFRPGSTSEAETCSLLSRIVDDTNGEIDSYLDVGVDNTGVIYFLDVNHDASQTNAMTPEDFDLTAPHHFLIIAQNDLVTVFIDGSLAFTDAPSPERAGTYGIALRGRGPDALCEGTAIWAYEAPSFQPGVCEISVANAVNKRSGPGTNFDRAGELLPGSPQRAQGSTTAEDGFLWWQLDDETWVRSDIVTAQGDCNNLPSPQSNLVLNLALMGLDTPVN